MTISAGVRPEFLVIGAQKCATTWLYYCLKEHPALHLPRRKREVEYLGGDLYQERGADWYFSLLDGKEPHQKAGDVSVDYLFDPRSPGVVHKHAKDVKFILSLRDPIARAVSAHSWYLRKGHIPDLAVERALALGVANGDSEFDSETQGFLRDIIERGFYDVQLQRYRDLFAPGQFLVVLYEDIAAAPYAVLQQIYRFLGVEPSFVPGSLNRTPKKNSYTPFLVALERFASTKPRFFSRLIAHVTDRANHWLSNRERAQNKPLLSAGLRKELRAVYRPHNTRLQELLAELPPTQRPDTALEDAWA